MNEYSSLEFLRSISIEIGTHCNLCLQHLECPNSYLNRDDKDGMSDEKILEIMDQAVELGFKGLFAFHFYNEPLLYIERINKLHNERPNYKLLLWSNGTLIKHALDLGIDFNIFDKIVFTKYKESDIKMMNYIKRIHKNTEIYNADMDERLSFYKEGKSNIFTCKKVYIEMPIDYMGNIHICSFDWKGEYIIGDLKKQSMRDILFSDLYQAILKENYGRLRHSSCIELCEKCTRPCLKSLIM